MLTFESHIYHQDQSQHYHHHNRCSGLILWFFFAHSPIGALWLWNWVKAGRSCIYFCLYHSKKQNKKRFTRLLLLLSLSLTPSLIFFDPLLCVHLKILDSTNNPIYISFAWHEHCRAVLTCINVQLFCIWNS